MSTNNIATETGKQNPGKADIIPVTQYKTRETIQFAYDLLKRNGYKPYFETGAKNTVRVVRKREPGEIWPLDEVDVKHLLVHPRF